MAYNQAFPFKTTPYVVNANEALIHYVVIMLLPIHSFYTANLLMTPFLLFATVLVYRAKFRVLQDLVDSENTEKLTDLIEVPETIYGPLIFLAAFIFWSHYYAELQTLTLIIEKHKIQKLQKQMHDFFKAQKQAIVLYKLESGPDKNSENSRMYVPLQNPAVGEILSVAFP